MKPMTLRERVDKAVEEYSKDPALFGSVLDGMAEKKASMETPPEVLRMAKGIETDTGMEKEAALRVAWETYLRYVNPDFMKNGGKMPPQFQKNQKGKPPAKKEEKKKFPFKSAAAIDLASKLGMTAQGEIVKEAPKDKKKAPQKKMEPKTAAARDLAKALGV